MTSVGLPKPMSCWYTPRRLYYNQRGDLTAKLNF